MRRMRQILAVLMTSMVAAALFAFAPAQAATPFPEAQFSGSATGTVVHSDELQSGQTRVVNADEAFSAAAVNSTGLAAGTANEMQRPVVPAGIAPTTAYGRGSGIEVGLASAPNAAPQVTQAGLAEAKAGPMSGDSQLQTKEAGPVAARPAAYASLVRGQARARWSDSTCILGGDLAMGLGYAADAQLVDQNTATGTGPLVQPLVSADAANPARAAAQSRSALKLGAQTNGKDNNLLGADFGLIAETRQTIAPVTLFKGTANQVTIEILGEWVLQAVAGGVPGAGFVHYGPGDASPSTPVLRTINSAGNVTDVVTLQQILGPTGRQVVVPGVLEITVGEAPRAIGGAFGSAPAIAADGTSAAAAVDVVRIKLLEQKDQLGNVTQRAADIRVGHMEVTAKVPAGGITCGIKVTKSADRDEVTAGESFTYTITVSNPFDCTLTGVKVVDTITTPAAIKYKITGSNPPANETLADGLTWNDVGPIKPGESKTLTVSIETLASSGAGRFVNVANATALCGVDTGRGGAGVNVPVNGSARVEVPKVNRAPGELPATGGPSGLALGGVVTFLGGLGALAMRRRLVARPAR